MSYFIPIIVGSVFTGLAYLLHRSTVFYKKYGLPTTGTVIGIEEYLSTSTNKSKSILYRPIIEYYFDGKPYLFSGTGKSTGLEAHKIGQIIKLLYHPKGPEYVYIKNGTTEVFTIVFGMTGIICLGFAVYSIVQALLDPKGFQLDIFGLIPFILFLSSIIFVLKKIKKYKKENGKIDIDFNKQSIITQEDLARRKVYSDNFSIRKTVNKHNKFGLGISMIFFIIISSLFYNYWNHLSISKKEELMALFQDHNRIIDAAKNFNPNKDIDLIIIGFFLFFILMACYSLIYSIRKITNS